MVKDHPDIGAVVLECSEFPPHAFAIQNAVRRPVCGFTTLAYWIHATSVRSPFTDGCRALRFDVPNSISMRTGVLA